MDAQCLLLIPHLIIHRPFPRQVRLPRLLYALSEMVYSLQPNSVILRA